MADSSLPHDALFLGFDSSTQSMKATVLDSDLRIVRSEAVHFDTELPHYKTKDGVYRDLKVDGRIVSPTIMWVEALDLVLEKLSRANLDFGKIVSVSVSGQQHGSVYWTTGSANILSSLDSGKRLVEQLGDAFSTNESLIWMDSSTTWQCIEIEEALRGAMGLSKLTGSRAYERFTGPQIHRIFQTQPEVYNQTERISLVSSFVASLLIGEYAPIDQTDGAGMNLVDIKNRTWSKEALEATAPGLACKLGELAPAHAVAGSISSYFVERFHFDKNCLVIQWSRDNPNSLAGLTLSSPGELAISLGTSDTPLFIASNSNEKNQCLEILTLVSKSVDGRSTLASQNIVSPVIKLLEKVLYPLDRELLLSSLRLLRNLCAGNISNQNLFIEDKGVDAILSVIASIRSSSVLDDGIVRFILQVLGNVCLGGKEHQFAVWKHIFPTELVEIAKVQKCGTCDPLCMIIYTCSDGNNDIALELFGDRGLPVVAEIVRTASQVGFVEDWFKLLISRACLEDTHFALLFSELYPAVMPDVRIDHQFSDEQAFLLQIVGDILNERLKEIIAPINFSSAIMDIFTKAVASVDFTSRTSSGLPTGSPLTNVLGYSLTLIRDLCAQGDSKDGSAEVVESLISKGLLDLLLDLLRQLEPPTIVKKGMEQAGSSLPFPSKLCPYKGFRRDIVGVIGNCTFHRKHVQDYIRKQNGIILLLQQCVTDEENPYLREWGICSIRNLLEDNPENQKEVADLQIQGAVDVPEVSGLGLKLEVDEQTGRAKLVNIPT